MLFSGHALSIQFGLSLCEQLEFFSLTSFIADANIFVRKREEHKLLVNHLQSIEDYSKRYKLMKLGIDEILRVRVFSCHRV